MSKLEQVLKFMNRKNKGSFTWKEYMSHFGGTYPNTFTNYLSMLVKAQYVARVGRGQYEIWVTPARGMGYAQLKRESSLKFNASGEVAKNFSNRTLSGRAPFVRGKHASS